MYAKYLNEYEIEYYRGNILRYGGICYSNPSSEAVNMAGYKPVIEGEQPAILENGILVISYVNEPDCIRRIYRVESVT